MLMPFALAVAWLIVVAGLGIWLTRLDDWYESLAKPGWKPPDAWFGPIWTTIFLLQAIAFALAWDQGPSASQKFWLILAFLINGLLNVMWNVLFFRWQRPDWAQWQVIALWLSIAWMMWLLFPLRPLSAVLLLPYLLWVGTAAVLTRSIVRLNEPFARQVSQ